MQFSSAARLTLFFSFSVLVGIGGGFVVHGLLTGEDVTPPKNEVSDGPNDASTSSTAPLSVTAAGGTFETAMETDGVGTILVQVIVPPIARFSDGAPVVVSVPTYFTPEVSGFHPLDGLGGEGIISVALMYPGRSDGLGKSSGGVDDYGGVDSIKALRDVVLFALGEKTNSDGYRLDQLSAITPLYSNVGLYAFSHPGLAATAVLGTYAKELKNVQFFVGRENPTLDLLSTLELGHWNEKMAVTNSLYQYPQDYGTDAIQLDYSRVRYDLSTSSPFFDLNDNEKIDGNEFSLGTQVPKMFGKRYYSAALLHALQDNNALITANWPNDLATPEDADATWPSRESNTYYSMLSDFENLHVMLVFAENDHVQTNKDKPHIHQAYNGFHNAGRWVRLNPDASYVETLDEQTAGRFTEHAANSEPSDWLSVASWAFPNLAKSIATVPLAAVDEMVDRVHAGDWSADLSAVLTSSVSSPALEKTPASTSTNTKNDCGDGVCVAPENPDRCPADCPKR